MDTAILLGLFLGLTAFWNGAALIGGLLILAGLAVFSDGKLDYVICAGLAVRFFGTAVEDLCVGKCYESILLLGLSGRQ